MNSQTLTSIALGLFISASALVTSASAADDAKNAGTASGRLSVAEEKFVLNAAQGGMTEVKLGELAKQKGKRDDVRKFGDQMVDDHSQINDELKALASKKSVTLPTQLDATHAGVLDRLSKLEGDQFDKGYIDDMLSNHKKDVAEFDAAAKAVKDPDLKGFISKSLPTLHSHLAQIKGIDSGSPK